MNERVTRDRKTAPKWIFAYLHNRFKSIFIICKQKFSGKSGKAKVINCL